MSQMPSEVPLSETYISQRLKLHYLAWGRADAPLLVLLHGGQDHARSWDAVAKALRADFHVVAPDLRGHGDSEWATGASYGIADYVTDLAQLLKILDRFPAVLLAHSMGGAVALHYAGAYPERVSKLIAIEGLGPPPSLTRTFGGDDPADRLRHWVRERHSLSRRQSHRYGSLQEAIARMREANPRLSEAQAEHLTVHGAQREEDGAWVWKFDPGTRAVAPILFSGLDAVGLWGQITCPTLLVRGTESWAVDPVESGQIRHFRNARAINIEGAGHWVHHDRLEELMAIVREFLAGR